MIDTRVGGNPHFTHGVLVNEKVESLTDEALLGGELMEIINIGLGFSRARQKKELAK